MLEGCYQLTKREVLDDIMKRYSYDLLLLTETNINTCSWEKWGSSTCFFSSDIDPKIREREVKKREDSSLPGRFGAYSRTMPDFEHSGVGIAIKTSLLPSLRDIRQINGRIIIAEFELSFICAYAPHSGHNIEKRKSFMNSYLMRFHKSRVVSSLAVISTPECIMLEIVTGKYADNIL